MIHILPLKRIIWRCLAQNRVSDSRTFFLLSQGCFSCSRAYVFYTNFRIKLFMSTENLVGISVGITLNLKINLNRADIFIGLNHLIHEYSMSLHWFRFSFFKFHFNFLTPKTFCIAAELFNNVVIVSGEQRRDSAICKHVSILPQNFIPSRLAHNVEQSSMCYTICFVGYLF